MINFDLLENNLDDLRLKYLIAKPYPHLVLDNFCDEEKLLKAYNSIPELDNKSRDYAFANNKFEKSNYKVLGAELEELYNDLSSDRFNKILSYIVNKDIFVDPKNHGGGLHQGKKNSFLDMHLDFNYHPINKNWYRELNLLLYLNKDWKPEYKGDLKLVDLRTYEEAEVSVPFNRLIIQQCAPYTLHGYEMTNFPEGIYRTSIATYAYQEHKSHIETPRTTDWHPNEDASFLKKQLAKNYNVLVQTKNKFFGSGTAKNQ
ncbi:2OG-Fe(II) oxygenase [Empedobacter stercoris]|uniref:2OG-Fe(II) oxygenase n=1 Tax=Empedobacter stercoris TaxID=1628248 RepID=UPI0016626685|nr:2OG-Fe(II) oxygenase [Empedobacter stercoris]MCA4808786.1 2OG-Fe(II) oxygenase [Empedobacter stercoris]QNT15315.1 2OG-Fe(II) oxygenase [Empedobacter stercoris]